MASIKLSHGTRKSTLLLLLFGVKKVQSHARQRGHVTFLCLNSIIVYNRIQL